MSILDLFSLHGQVAVVTGASRGIGQGLAVALAEAGADLVVTATGDCAETCARVHAVGRECVTIAADLGQPDAPARVIDAALTSYGRIVMAVNSTAVFKLSQAAARGMAARRRGKIINLASMLSFQGGIRVPSYTASKSAVMGLTRLMACELGPLGINTNAIAPGYIATDNTAPLRADPARNQAILERIPAGRWGTPDDLAGAVVYLASRASDYLNGHTLAVDGGWLAR